MLGGRVAPDGTAFPGAVLRYDRGNWTKGGKDGTAMVGHFDAGPNDSSWASWNSSHRRAAAIPNRWSHGRSRLFYCFAAK
jgi:hypothetical protein